MGKKRGEGIQSFWGDTKFFNGQTSVNQGRFKDKNWVLGSDSSNPDQPLNMPSDFGDIWGSKEQQELKKEEKKELRKQERLTKQQQR